MRLATILAPLCLAACATFPEVDQAEAGLLPGPAPVLLPTEDLVARTAPNASIDNPQATLEARAAALRARAAGIGAPGT
jgi:hypothetical protein